MQVRNDISRLIATALPLTDLNQKALERDPDRPAFPVNGSASRINRVFEELVLDQCAEFFVPRDNQNTELLEEQLSGTIDEQLSKMDKNIILAQAKAFDNSMAESHYTSYGLRKIRKENQIQKRRVAALENYTCQLCGFRCEYIRTNGKRAWIIHVDHILEKAAKGSENLTNLWVLCPNCHSKKTYGVINIDLARKKITDGEREIRLWQDNHLFL